METVDDFKEMLFEYFSQKAIVLLLSVRKNWKQSINFGLRNIFAKNGSSVVESG